MTSSRAASVTVSSLLRQSITRLLASAILVFGMGPGGTAVWADQGVVIQLGESEPVKNWVRAVEAGDIESIAAMNSPKTIAYVPNAMVVIGSDAITPGYAGMFEKYHAKVKIKDAQYIDSAGLVHSWGLYALTLSPKAGGDSITMEGRFSDIATQVNGRWQYILDHASLPSK